ncbi:hypothetical protein BC833DRAFT_46138 [Globomyces pollinis-pini]|nr:hypothetical protein BC833DRAFT_46138 [Globomyces pollinis-pini]
MHNQLQSTQVHHVSLLHHIHDILLDRMDKQILVHFRYIFHEDNLFGLFYQKFPFLDDIQLHLLPFLNQTIYNLLNDFQNDQNHVEPLIKYDEIYIYNTFGRCILVTRVSISISDLSPFVLILGNLISITSLISYLFFLCFINFWEPNANDSNKSFG